MPDSEFYRKIKENGITVQRTGKQTCPQCSAQRTDKSDKCLSVSYEDSAVVYYCHHCGWTGSIPYYENKHKRQYNRPTGFKNKEDMSPLEKYFKARGISKATLEKYKIGYDENNHIVFPYYKDGILVNIKTRKNLGNGKKEFTQTKDAEKTFFGIDFAKEQKDLIIVEGEVDVLSLAEQGIFAVSVPQGGSDTKLECLSNCTNEFLQSFESYIIAVDNDTTGEKLKNTLLGRLPKDKCKIVQWNQYKDANEALKAGEDLHKFINSAKYVQTDGIVSFDDSRVWDKLYMELFGSDEVNVYETGWHSFDELVKIKTGHLMVVTGYPSRGKSYFVKNMLVNVSKKYGVKHLIASFEDTLGSLYKDLFQMYVGKTIYKIQQLGKDKALEKVLCGPEYEFIYEHFKTFENDRFWDIDSIIERTEIEVIKHGIKTLIIDPYNRLKNDYTEREDKYVGSILAKLCMLAKKLDILVVFIAHPKKPQAGSTDDAPDMYQISGSGDWYNMADYGIIIHRKRNSNGKLENIVEVNVQKVKNFSLGDPKGGVITLRFDPIEMNIKNF